MDQRITSLRALLALVLIATVLWAPAAGASHEQTGTYQIPVWFTWERAELDVLVVPPNHGQIVNGNGVANGGDPMELTPFNSYLRAIEDSIEEWHRGIELFAPTWLKEALVTNVYVLGRDIPPQSALTQPEIVIVTDETKGPILGVAFSTRPCIVDNSKFFVQSFTYQDMYNVNAHEFGHCLGLEHIVDDHPQRDVMDSIYRGPVSSSDAPLHCVSNLNIAGLERVFGGLFGMPSGGVASVPVSAYATTCSGASGTTEPAPDPQPSPGPQPSPSPTPASSPTPQSSPSQEPSPTPEPNPSSEPSPTPEASADPSSGDAPERDPRCPPGAACGTAGDDILTGTDGDDLIYGFEGNDTIYGRGGNDVILAGKGNDVVYGGPGHDEIRGAAGSDDLRGGAGRDLLFGGRGFDVLRGGRGRDVLRGGPGNDVLRGGRGIDRCIGGPGKNRLFGCER